MLRYCTSPVHRLPLLAVCLTKYHEKLSANVTKLVQTEPIVSFLVVVSNQLRLWFYFCIVKHRENSRTNKQNKTWSNHEQKRNIIKTKPTRVFKWSLFCLSHVCFLSCFCLCLFLLVILCGILWDTKRDSMWFYAWFYVIFAWFYVILWFYSDLPSQQIRDE